MSVLKRLTVLRQDAEAEPVPQRRYFHIGNPEVMDDVGECIPMIVWIDDNLSRFVLSDNPSVAWGKPGTRLFTLPNKAVKAEDGLFVITGSGDDRSVPHPNGKGSIHFVHLGAAGTLWDKPGTKIYVYRLDGLQLRAVGKKR